MNSASAREAYPSWHLFAFTTCPSRSMASAPARPEPGGALRARRRPADAMVHGTRTFRAMQGQQGGSAGVDDAFASDWGPGIGAEIMGRNKFGPQRGPWADEEWQGWWGDDPPFHTPVFVLTHHARPSIEMKGGTTFHFIDASPEVALAAAKEAAGGLTSASGAARHRSPVPGRRPDRPPAHRDRADRPRPRRAPLGGSGGPGGALRHRVGEFAQRGHPRHLHPSLAALFSFPPPVGPGPASRGRGRARRRCSRRRRRRAPACR